MNMEPAMEGNTVPQTTGAPKIEPIPVPFTGTDVLFAALAFVCGYLFIWLIFFHELGLGVTLFTLFFCGMTLGYVKMRGITPSRSSWAWLGITLLSGLQFFLFSNTTLKVFNFLFLGLSAVYWAACVTSGRLEGSLGNYFTADLANLFFKVPFRNFGCGFSVLWRAVFRNENKSKNHKFLTVLLGVAVAVPILCIVVPLLARADESFHTLVGWFNTQDFFENFPELFSEFLARLPFAILVGCYLFGMLYGCLQKRRWENSNTERVDTVRKKRQVLPTATTATVLILLSAVYVVFLVSQFVSLITAVVLGRPQSTSYSEFARESFFELCKVASVNLAVMLGAHVFAARKENRKSLFRWLNVLLTGETMLIIVSAIGKMVLYISEYGLTQLRVYTSWFMVVLFLTFALILVRQFKSFPLVKLLSVMFIVCFMGLCYSSPNTWIVRYNITRYQAGSLPTFNPYEHIELDGGSASIPAVAELSRQTTDPKLKMELLISLKEYSERSRYQQEFMDWNLQDIRANRIVEEMAPQLENIHTELIRRS